jgi:acetoin utilization protein AcuC
VLSIGIDNAGGCPRRCVVSSTNDRSESAKARRDSVLVCSSRFGDFSYGDDHPFTPKRTLNAVDMIRRQGYLDEPWMRVVEPEPIEAGALATAHAQDYIDALESANDGRWRDEYIRYGLGTQECPIFLGLFEYALMCVSATVTGVDAIARDGAGVAFNPLGGFHHAGRAMAEGFCYVNDVVIAIEMLLARRMRVAYVDIDAHHGNGVQDAYYEDDRVLVVSLHQTGKTLYPWSGFEDEIGSGIGEGYTVNVPLPEQTDDDLYGMAMDEVVTPAVERFAPTVVVATIGADTHRNDPLTNLSLTNNGMVSAVKKLRAYSPSLLMLGGGGYDIDTTVAAWSRMWAAANGIDDLPDHLLAVGGAFMGSAGIGAEIVDMPYRLLGPQKDRNTEEVERIVRRHVERTLPLIR